MQLGIRARALGSQWRNIGAPSSVLLLTSKQVFLSPAHPDTLQLNPCPILWSTLAFWKKLNHGLFYQILCFYTVSDFLFAFTALKQKCLENVCKSV
jgi:hypothetical protein